MTAITLTGRAHPVHIQRISNRIAATIDVGSHTHPDLQEGIETTQAMLDQVLAGQATILDTLNSLAENQARMQNDITAMQRTITEMQATIATIQTDIGQLARGLAIVQADVALLVARDSYSTHLQPTPSARPASSDACRPHFRNWAAFAL